MVNETCAITIDALPHGLSIAAEDIIQEDKNDLLNSILDDFTTEQFKSVFFLLIDYIGKDDGDFFTITKQEKSKLKENFREIIKKHSTELLIELIGTLKMYKHLKALGTCSHIFKNCEEMKFNKIDSIWKMLLSLCEEITDNEFVLLKNSVGCDFRDEIVAAEDYFYWAFKKELFCKTDLSKLQEIFIEHPTCSKIIQDFKAAERRYPVKIPTANSHCGIALIFNFDKFDNLPEREGSNIDVSSLKDLWNEFGFQTKSFQNLTYKETFEELMNCAATDHSNYDVFVCCFLSHGRLNSVISSDGVNMPIPTLVAKVVNYSESLISKPKLFFIQACQGTYIQEGLGKPIYYIKPPEESSIKEIKVETPPIASDVLLAISSIEGYVSFRHPKTGSWFINALCNSLKASGVKKSILDVMTDVTNDVHKQRADLGYSFGPKAAEQIVECRTTLDKILILKKRIC